VNNSTRPTPPSSSKTAAHLRAPGRKEGDVQRDSDRGDGRDGGVASNVDISKPIATSAPREDSKR
jgi:hypothetical protein